MRGALVPHIAANHIRDGDRRGVTWVFGRRSVTFAGEVFGKRLLSPATVVNAASSAFLVSLIVADEPSGFVGDAARSVSPFSAEPQARPFGGFWHSSLIRSMLASVV